MPMFKAPDGTNLHYTDQGDGLPLLALSGLTRNGTDFDYVAPHLGNVRLIRLDYRGRGKSEWADPVTYTIPVEAGDAIALMDHLGIEKAAILGTSCVRKSCWRNTLPGLIRLPAPVTTHASALTELDHHAVCNSSIARPAKSRHQSGYVCMINVA